MNDALRELLQQIDTPTLCNAIEMAEGRRGFPNFTRAPVHASDPGAGALVGRAVTARIRASAPPEEPAEAVRARRMAYYRLMAEAPRPAVAVIEDEDGAGAVGAFWGEINATVHKGLGVAGTLTNGLMRDLGDLPEGFPILAGGIGPSHAFVHVTALDVPVTVLGLEVVPGQLIHADQHGAVAVPEALIPTLPEAIDRLIPTERIILDAARAPGFDFAAFERAWAEFEAART